MRFLAIGECLAELAPAAAPGEFRLGFAGDTYNSAWYLARLRPDISVSFLSAVGTDTISQQMRGAFAEGGIDDTHVRILPDRTVGLYLISLDNGERSFSYWRGQSAARQLAEDPDAVAKAMEDADLIYFSGITLAILNPSSRETLLNALRRARDAGKTIAFDPNLRPRLWSSTSEMTDVVMHGADVSDIALPSFEDEAHWFHDASPTATADRYAAAGVTTVVVKNGADPVHYRQGMERGTVQVPPLSAVVDTTAAGDSFNAAFLANSNVGPSMASRIAMASAVAGQVVGGKGALVPLDWTRLEGWKNVPGSRAAAVFQGE